MSMASIADPHSALVVTLGVVDPVHVVPHFLHGRAWVITCAVGSRETHVVRDSSSLTVDCGSSRPAYSAGRHRTCPRRGQHSWRGRRFSSS